jgi:cytoskeleton protein RodZ
MGQYLRHARRRRRVSIERAAEETKIRADFLMRMESDEFDFLAPAYVRGFLRTYARYLRVDPDPLIHEFERRHGERVDTAQLLAEGRRRSAPKEGPRINSWVLAGGAAFLVIVFLAIIGLTAGEDRPSRTAGEATPLAPESPTPETSLTPEVTPTPEETPAEDVLALDEGIEVVVDAVRDDCWVDVTADGTKLFSDTIEAGTSETFTAERGMTIILGFPRGVDLVINGHSFGAPGDVDPVTIKLPDDIDSL